MRFLISTLTYLAANAVGLLLATLLLPGFQIDPLSFLIAVVVFSLVQSVLGMVFKKISEKRFPELMGGIALITIFFGLFVTELLMQGMQIGGISNWLAATFLVWLGSLIAAFVLPRYVFKSKADQPNQT